MKKNSMYVLYMRQIRNWRRKYQWNINQKWNMIWEFEVVYVLMLYKYIWEKKIVRFLFNDIVVADLEILVCMTCLRYYVERVCRYFCVCIDANTIVYNFCFGFFSSFNFVLHVFRQWQCMRKKVKINCSSLYIFF